MSTNNNSNEKNEFDDAFGQFKDMPGYNALKEELLKIGVEHPEWKKLIDLPMCKAFPSIDWSNGIFLKSFMTMSLEIQDDLLEQYSKSLESGGGDFVFNLIKQFATYKFIANYLETRKEFSKNTPKDLCILNTTLLSAIIATFTVSATTEKFVAKDKFKVDTRKKAMIKISHLDDDFKEWFLGKIEDPFPGSTIYERKLKKNSVDRPILAELDGSETAETTLTEVCAVMEARSNSKGGNFFPDNCIFYVRDINGTLRAVNVFWDGDAWGVDAFSVKDLRRWDIDDRFFSRTN